MMIPTWALIAGSVFLYFLTGVAHAVITAFKEGKGDGGMLYTFGGVGLTLLWPVFDLLAIGFWVTEQYINFLDYVKKRGEISVMPPENEGPGRRI